MPYSLTAQNMQIQPFNGDFSFCYCHLPKNPDDVSTYHNSEVTELIFMFRTDDTETSMFEILSVLC